jgi:hypothetical protein
MFYIQSMLRSAKYIYIFKSGGLVSLVYRDQQIRMHFYNKRILELPLFNPTEELATRYAIMGSQPLDSFSQGEN